MADLRFVAGLAAAARAEQSERAVRDAAAVRAEAAEERDRMIGDATRRTQALLANAQREHDELVEKARKSHDEMLASASAERDRLLSEGRTEHDTLLEAAKAQQARFVADGSQTRDRLVAEGQAENERLLSTAREEYRRLVDEATEEHRRLLDIGRSEHDRLISEAEAQHLVAGLPVDLARQLRRVRSDAASGTETRVRWWLESMHVAVRSQVQVCRGIRVDLLVGSSWVIECDSRAHHAGDEQYHRDRWRDLTLRAMGYTVTRLSWEQVFLQWEATEQMLRSMLHRREHRRVLRA